MTIFNFHWHRTMMLFSALLVSTGLLVSTPGYAAPNTADQQTIEYLIDFVAQSDMTFVRNFSKHEPERAAKHIRDKYDYFFDEIDSPEKFIELCATKSLLTGQKYKVIDPLGKETKTSRWLLDALKAYRSQLAKSS